MRKKRQFHCQKCGSGCTTYRKGRAHRVLVCPNCGVIATNPSVTGALGGASTGATIGSLFPGIGTLVGAGVGALVGSIGSDNKPDSPPLNYGKLTLFEKAAMLDAIESRGKNVNHCRG